MRLLELLSRKRHKRSRKPSHNRRRRAFRALENRYLLTGITVDTTIDENNGIDAGTGTSLREAITFANSNAGTDAIRFKESQNRVATRLGTTATPRFHVASLTTTVFVRATSACLSRPPLYSAVAAGLRNAARHRRNRLGKPQELHHVCPTRLAATEP